MFPCELRFTSHARTIRILASITLALMFGVSSGPVFAQRETLRLTHGPMLGKPTAHSMSVWGRTSETGQFSVRYGANADRLDQMSKPVTTSIDHDNTGVAE